MRNNTLYQCFQTLARYEGTISLAPHPDDPCKTRCAVRMNDAVAGIEYDCTEEKDLLDLFLTQVCNALETEMENREKVLDIPPEDVIIVEEE